MGGSARQALRRDLRSALQAGADHQGSPERRVARPPTASGDHRRAHRRLRGRAGPRSVGAARRGDRRDRRRDRVHAARRARGLRRLHRSRGEDAAVRDGPLVAHARRARPVSRFVPHAPRCGAVVRGGMAFGGRLPHRHQQRLHRRRARVQPRHAGRSPRLARRRDEVDGARRERRTRRQAGEGQGRRPDARRGTAGL